MIEESIQLNILTILKRIKGMYVITSMDYIVSEIANIYPHLQGLNIRPYTPEQKTYIDLIEFSLNYLVESGYIRATKHEVSVSSNGQSKMHERILYGIEPKGLAFLKQCELYGMVRMEDWKAVEKGLYFMPAYGIIDLIAIQKIVHEFDVYMDVPMCERILVDNGFCEKGNLNRTYDIYELRFTDRGRLLKRLGSWEKLRTYDNKLIMEERTAEERLRIERKRSDNEAIRNRILFAVTLILAVSGLVQGLHDFVEIRDDHGSFYESIFPLAITATMALVFAGLLMFPLIMRTGRKKKEDVGKE